MRTPSGFNNVMTGASTSLLARTSTRSATAPTSTLTPCTLMRSLIHYHAGSTTYALVPLPLTTPCVKPCQISTIGMRSQRLNVIATTTTTATALPLNSTKSRPNSSSSRTPFTPPNTNSKWCTFLLSFSTLRVRLSHRPNVDAASPSKAPAEATTTMDQELHSRTEGDVIVMYWCFNVVAVNGKKHKSLKD